MLKNLPILTTSELLVGLLESGQSFICPFTFAFSLQQFSLTYPSHEAKQVLDTATLPIKFLYKFLY
ncbi:hypothetical protein NC651_035884 [Populus alba x Populus x berolinensis]|nr:hypothetical protein NC651_035884 [Populus alba x Populus x berolinensis]